MRELRTCDFCGGDAAGTFEVLPPELEPTEVEQRRVVLCAACKPTLEELLEPLLVRAGPGESTTASSTEDEATEAVEHGPVATSTADSTIRRERKTTTESGDAADEGGRTDIVGTGESNDETDASTVELESSHQDGITFDGFESSDAVEATDDEAADAESDSSDVTSADSSDDATNDSNDDATNDSNDDATNDPSDDTAGNSSDNATAESSTPQQSKSARKPPASYGKVIRLLQNREFPMKRTAVENLAAGAYDLEMYEVEAIVDYALETGEFVESDGKLRRE